MEWQFPYPQPLQKVGDINQIAFYIYHPSNIYQVEAKILNSPDFQSAAAPNQREKANPQLRPKH